jgi:small subunit ribosomal protein S5
MEQTIKKPGRSTGRPKREPSEFEQVVVDISRVTRVTKGGKQLSFRATVVVGDRKGRVGFGVAKGKDVQQAVEKAVRAGKKAAFRVQMTSGLTIPHVVYGKFSSGRVLINPAPKGTGLICGGAVRTVLELAGVENASSKLFSGKSKINAIKATCGALKSLRKPMKWQKESGE